LAMVLVTIAAMGLNHMSQVCAQGFLVGHSNHLSAKFSVVEI